LAEKKLLHKGTTKRIFASDDEQHVILQFNDVKSEFDGEIKSGFENKGKLRSAITAAIFEYLASYNIPTHLIRQAGENEIEVKKLTMIPVKVIVRNYAAGTLCARFSLAEGAELKYPILEYYLKDKKLNYPLITESHAYAFEYTTPEEMKHIARMASKVNAVLKAYLDRRKLKLIDYQLEFGRFEKQIYLGDEITPDTGRLWNILENGELDTKSLSYSSNKARSSYMEIHKRLLGKEASL